MASNEDDRSDTSQSLMVSYRGGDLMGRQRGRGSRCHAALQRVGGVTRMHIARRQATKRSRPRLQSCFAQGVRRIFVAVLDRRRLPLGRFIPEPWPTRMPPRKPSKKERLLKPLLTIPPADVPPLASEVVA